MEQRIYRGNVSGEGLADHLVSAFNNRDGLVAQRVGQGDNLLVQIGHTSYVGQVVCPECHQTVSAGKFCSNCGTRLAAANAS